MPLIPHLQVEMRDLNVQLTEALLATNDTTGAGHASDALGALHQMELLNYQVFVGSDGMLPISASSHHVVRWW
jgi:hypothetical protein